MGNYSAMLNQENCELDLKKFGDLCNQRNIACYKEIVDKLKKDNFGDCIDGWKIQGYWYQDFNKMLVAAAESMLELTEDEHENYIEMEEEQGYKFWIRFYKDSETKKPVVHIDYVPMEIWSFELDQNGKEINNQEGY